MSLGQKYVFLDYSMIEELYGIEKVEEILMHHSYVGVNLEQICPLIAHGGERYFPPPSIRRPFPALHPPSYFTTTPKIPSSTPKQQFQHHQMIIIPKMNENDQKIIDVLTVTDMPTDAPFTETAAPTTTEKVVPKKKDKKDEKEGMEK
uniref:Uncharacterized protein n=1 Tax=Panagrolaimus superbus TaxID=310955 RepID=A0A914XYA3_9BILA